MVILVFFFFLSVKVRNVLVIRLSEHLKMECHSTAPWCCTLRSSGTFSEQFPDKLVLEPRPGTQAAPAPLVPFPSSVAALQSRRRL